MMKSVFGLIFLSLFWFACEEDKDCCTNIDTEFSFEVYDTDSVSLLDPTNPDAYQERQIDIYYLIDGEKKRVFYANYDLPESFSIGQHEITGEYVMRLSPNDEADGETTTTYIQWNQQEMDTVTCTFARGENYIITTKISYNGRVVWDVEDKTSEPDRYFEIRK